MTATKRELTALRERLEALVERLSGGVQQLRAEATRPVGAEGTEAEPIAQDPELAGSEADAEVARGLLTSEGQVLDEARAALARIRAGTFGQCERCGRPIAQARLDALPYARNCIRCARDAESETGD